ncbi:hypothetical protein AMTR_s00079p00174220 [Amborella trichopoda]|uniref:Uncharacterized protein n=1 Tax=Amborella trichopoda TaxID=13333 RepID=W1P7V8_AMBTC|nr:hypothetical protein AMTR_s00079p00174220 [Amborella trichopoda]
MDNSNAFQVLENCVGDDKDESLNCVATEKLVAVDIVPENGVLDNEEHGHDEVESFVHQQRDEFVISDTPMVTDTSLMVHAEKEIISLSDCDEQSTDVIVDGLSRGHDTQDNKNDALNQSGGT